MVPGGAPGGDGGGGHGNGGGSRGEGGGSCGDGEKALEERSSKIEEDPAAIVTRKATAGGGGRNGGFNKHRTLRIPFNRPFTGCRDVAVLSAMKRVKVVPSPQPEEKKVSRKQNTPLLGNNVLQSSRLAREYQEQRRKRMAEAEISRLGYMCNNLCHSILLCKCEVDGSFCLAKEIGMLTECKEVPGSSQSMTSLTIRSRLILRSIFKVLARTRRNNLSFNGGFTLENFFWTRHQEIKIYGVEPIPSSSGAQRDADIYSLYNMLHDEFFWKERNGSSELPSSIAALFDVMRQRPPHPVRATLILNHISTFKPLKRMSEFGRIYKQFKGLPKEIQDTIACTLNDVGGSSWKTTVKNNIHLKAVFEYNNQGRGPTQYADGASGLLHFIRNAMEHLMEHAYDKARHIWRFQDYEIDAIISGSFPGFIESFQQIMEAHC